jgi:UDP-GlcNAc:undecaprenyl-phosphate/decaprenyl-phosphate GlcNAc-1-phosphate transferase
MSPTLTFALYGFGICALLHLAALTIFPKLKLLDRPGKYQLSRLPLPYPTGILTIITFLILFIVTRDALTFQDKGLITCIVILAVITFIDDFKNLPAWTRLLVQIIIGFLLFATGTRIYTITNPLGGIIKLDTLDIASQFFGPLPMWSGVFTIIWILLTMNAFNWFDGIPGQVSVLSIIGSLAIGILALSSRVNQPEIAVIAFIILGCAVASAVFDFPPNKVVMGDTGAMFFGLMLGALSIYAGGKVATALLVLGVPLIDAIFVIFRRIREGRSPFKGGDDHLHHRLLKKGWTERQVILLTAGLGSAFGITALFLNTFGKFVAIILLLIVMLLLSRHARSPSVHRPQ